MSGTTKGTPIQVGVPFVVHPAVRRRQLLRFSDYFE
jgi:hypothetical protein